MKRGYTAALEFPWKLLKCNEAVVDGKIIPYHIQFSPTNRCNGNCRWCSVSKIDRTLEMNYEEASKMITYFSTLGTKAITITGGGEPTIHNSIGKIISVAKDLGLQVGIVTNGLWWGREKFDSSTIAPQLTWARMSIIDTEGDYNCKRVEQFAYNFKCVDIGISFTTTPSVNIETAKRICQIANHFENITHVRFVQDILNSDDSGITKVKEACESITDKAIFQYRNAHGFGATRCLISKLKPYIDPRGLVFPCCGVQYATDQTRYMPTEFSMGHWADFENMDFFNGSICKRCHYEKYNDALSGLTEQIEHERFL